MTREFLWVGNIPTRQKKGRQFIKHTNPTPIPPGYRSHPNTYPHPRLPIPPQYPHPRLPIPPQYPRATDPTPILTRLAMTIVSKRFGSLLLPMTISNPGVGDSEWASKHWPVMNETTTYIYYTWYNINTVHFIHVVQKIIPKHNTKRTPLEIKLMKLTL